MTGTKKVIAAAAMALVAAGCATVPKVAVRPLPTVLAQGRQPVSFRVTEATGQLALGNVALALESYRKAVREEPASVEALTGMAVCYDVMGRYDLSRRHYEEALALAPANSHLLGMFAASLLQQGRSDEAAAVRREVADRAAAPARPAPVDLSSDASVSAVHGLDQAGSSVTLELPVARESEQVTVRMPTSRVEPVDVGELPHKGPRLERMSLGEVALITIPQRSQRLPASRAPSPVHTASAGAAPLLLLNAARTEGLAARTRRYLSTRGFAMAVVGDAPRIRVHTLIIAPAADRARALHLARTFSVTPQLVEGRRLTLILGRDVLGPRASRA